MSGDGRSSCVDQILKAIDFGQLTYDETERRLQQLIDEETSQIEHPANADMLDACYSLLLQLHTHGSITYRSEKERNWQAIRQRVQAHRHRSDVWRKIGLSAAAAFTLLFLGSLLHFHWFEGTSTPDGQQYVVQGHEITSQMIETAIAEHKGLQVYDVEDTAQLASLLGFDPAVPTSLNNEWFAQGCTLTFFPDYIHLVIRYDSSVKEADSIIYSQFFFCDANNAYLSFEQSADGVHQFVDKYDIYISENEGRITCVWHDQFIVSNLVGQIGEDESLTLVKVLLGGM